MHTKILGFFFGGLLLIGTLANAEITLTVTGASVAIPEGDQYYFSNIGSSFVPGGVCSKEINPNCKNPSDIFSVTAKSNSPTTKNTRMFLVAAENIPRRGMALINSSSVGIFPTSISGQAVTFSTSFSHLCKAAGLNSNCDANGHPQIIVSVILDSNGNGIYDEGDDVRSFSLIVQSSIPPYSEGNRGVYKFEVGASKGSFIFKNLVADSSFPLDENFVGIKAIRFYYVIGSDQYDATQFNKINLKSAFWETKIDRVLGDLEKNQMQNTVPGKYYYFKVALVDSADNVGFLTPESSDVATHAAKSL